MDLRLGPAGWVVFHDPLPPRLKGNLILKAADALAFCRARKLEVYLDVKTPKGEASLARLIRGSGWARRVTLFSGKVPSLRRFRRLFSSRPLFWVTGYRRSIHPRDLALARRMNLTGFAVYKQKATRLAIQRAHQAGLKIFVWTARSAPELKRLAHLGVDGIMSEVWPKPRSI